MADVNRPISWDEEDKYWRTNYRSRPYAGSNDYDYYRPGYQYGYESASRYQNRNWDEVDGCVDPPRRAAVPLTS